MFHGDIHGTGASAGQSPHPRCDSCGPLGSHLSSTRAFANSGAVYLNLMTNSRNLSLRNGLCPSGCPREAVPGLVLRCRTGRILWGLR